VEPSEGSQGAFSDVSYRRRARPGGARAYAPCPIWASSVGRRDPVAAEPRSGQGKRVVEGLRGARGAIGGVSRVFGARVVPPAGALRDCCAVALEQLDALGEKFLGRSSGIWEFYLP